MSKKAHKRDPHLLGLVPLEFDNVSVDELTELTEKDKATLFLMTFQETFDPFKRFDYYFRSSAKEKDRILAEIKNYYTRLVERGDWSEKKYAKVLVRIFETNSPITVESFDKIGLLIDRTSGERPPRRRRL